MSVLLAMPSSERHLNPIPHCPTLYLALEGSVELVPVYCFDAHFLTSPQRLNLASIPCLRSTDLAGLLRDDGNDNIAPLKTLVLSNTGIDDEAGIYVSACKHLTTLAIAGTRFTSMSNFAAITV